MSHPVVLTAEEAASALNVPLSDIPTLIKERRIEGFSVGDEYRVRLRSVSTVTGLSPDSVLEMAGYKPTPLAGIF